MTRTQWQKAAKFCGFNTVCEYKKWYYALMSERAILARCKA